MTRYKPNHFYAHRSEFVDCNEYNVYAIEMHYEDLILYYSKDNKPIKPGYAKPAIIYRKFKK